MTDTNQKETGLHENGFGTFSGVFVPNVTMMFGVILFLRLTLVLGYLGIWEFLCVIAIGLAVMIITSLSISSVVTNMKVGGGGAYFLLSRSLGIEIGGALGIAIVLSQMISLSLVVTGFAYSITSLYPDISVITVEVVTMIGLLIVSSVSANLALKTQQIIFWTLCASILSILFFTVPRTVPLDLRYYPDGLTFWQGFAIFYPAFTGIEAGMAMSGNLKDPSRSLSKGNFWSLLFSAATYTSLALFLWWTFTPRVLQSSEFLLIDQSSVPFLIYMGIWLATLSSALGNLLGAPRMLQMIAEDGIAPEFLSRTFGAHKEPRYSTAVIFFASLCLILTTTIDQIIPILTMICLLTYGSMNLVAGFEELIHSPTWRPTVRTPWQLSFAGAIACYSLMFLINSLFAGVAILIVFALYIGLRWRGFDVNYQDLVDNIFFFFSRTIVYRLSEMQEHATTWHPHILFVARSPIQNETMLRIAHDMTQRSGILTAASIVPDFWSDPEQIDQLKSRVKEWMDDNQIRGFAEVQSYEYFYDGVEALIKSYGIGPLQPNTLWVPSGETFESDIDDMIRVVHTAQQNSKNLIISFFDQEENEKKPSFGRKRIDLWWDSDSRDSFELMMSYVLSLRTGAMWAKRTVNLRTTVPDKTARRHLEEHFQQLFANLRIKFKTKIEIETEGQPYQFWKKHSRKADLILVPLKPITDFEEIDDYKEYLLRIWFNLPPEIPTLAITSYDSLDHKEVYSG